jgi:hypothetical protein
MTTTFAECLVMTTTFAECLAYREVERWAKRARVSV